MTTRVASSGQGVQGFKIPFPSGSEGSSPSFGNQNLAFHEANGATIPKRSSRSSRERFSHFATCCLIHSVETDLGRVIGVPIARFRIA